MTEIDRNGLEVLPREECLRLLGHATLGRIAISSDALPMILPVTFRVHRGSIVFRTAPGSKLEAATRHAVVAFEVDEVDPMSHAGWSVVVTGVARPVEDPEPGLAGSIPHWAPEPADQLVAISLDGISGRRLGDPIPPVPR